MFWIYYFSHALSGDPIFLDIVFSPQLDLYFILEIMYVILLIGTIVYMSHIFLLCSINILKFLIC